MKRISRQQRILAGALLITGGAWLADRLLGGAGPAPVRAASARGPAPPVPAATSPADWIEVNALVERLTRRDYVPLPPELRNLTRELFAPTTVIEAAVVTAAPLAMRATTAPADDTLDSAEFVNRHKLTGVVIGPEPRAVVNDQILALGAELGGCRLVEIHRDRVVFEHSTSGERLVLEVRPGPRKP